VRFPSAKSLIVRNLPVPLHPITALINSRGIGGAFGVEVYESELVQTDVEYHIEKRAPRKVQVYIRQTKWEVSEDES
jgi:hypothetical protein